MNKKIYSKRQVAERDRVKDMSYKLEMLLTKIYYDVEERDRECIFSSKDYVNEIKSQIETALNAGVDINCLGEVSCLNAILEGCRYLPEIYRGIAVDLVSYVIDLGADVVSSGYIYENITPLEMTKRFKYDERVAVLIKTAIKNQQLKTDDQKTL